MNCRFDQRKAYLETLIEAFPYAIELWIELLSTIEQTEAIAEVRKFLSEIVDDRQRFRHSIAQENLLESIMNSFIPW